MLKKILGWTVVVLWLMSVPSLIIVTASMGTAEAQPGPSRQERALESIVSELKDLNRKLDKHNGLTNDNTRATNSLRDATKDLKRTIGNMR